MTKELSNADLEEAYDLIAEAIDQAGPARESLFLAKLCIVLARSADDLDAVRRAIAVAMEGIDAAKSQDPGPD